MNENDVRVLVVDDEEDMRATLGEFISRMGASVKTAGSVKEALAALERETPPFDLVLTDLKMPGGSGLEIVKAAHARNAMSLISIITGYASLESAIEAIRLGAYDYLTKPFTLDQIGIQVRNMMARVSLSKENSQLSIRLQELYAQIDLLREEKRAALATHEAIREELHQIGRKLDRLLAMNTTPGITRLVG